MKVLIAYDGSDCAKGAIQELRRAGLPEHVEAFVLSVAELVVDVGALPPDEAADSQTMSRMVREARALARSALSEARELAAAGAEIVTSQCPGWKFSAALAPGICSADANAIRRPAAAAALLR